MWIDDLTLDQRRAFALLTAYQEVRRKRQGGYRVFADQGPQVLQMPVFKQFMTVSAWIRQAGWKITAKESHWQGFVEYVFASLAPTIPQPGQLKNMMLLRKYVGSVPDVQVVGESPDNLEARYTRCLRRVSGVPIQSVLGLKGLEWVSRSLVPSNELQRSDPSSLSS